MKRRREDEAMTPREAAHCLGMKLDKIEELDEETARKKFRKASLTLHPDKAQQNPEVEKKYEELRKARDIVIDFIQKHKKKNGIEHAETAARIHEEKEHKEKDTRYFGQWGLKLTEQQAVSGGEHDVVIRTPHVCSECEGAGQKMTHETPKCSTCHGQGFLYTKAEGGELETKPCEVCDGHGKFEPDVDLHCTRCSGGLIIRKIKMKVSVSPGVRHREVLRVLTLTPEQSSQYQQMTVYADLGMPPKAKQRQ